MSNVNDFCIDDLFDSINHRNKVEGKKIRERPKKGIKDMKYVKMEDVSHIVEEQIAKCDSYVEKLKKQFLKECNNEIKKE